MRLRRYFWVLLILILLVVGGVLQLTDRFRSDGVPVSRSQATQTAKDYIGQRVQRLGTKIDVTRAEAQLDWAPESVFNPQTKNDTSAPQRRAWIVKLFYKGITPDAHLVVYVDANTGEPAGTLQSQ